MFRRSASCFNLKVSRKLWNLNKKEEKWCISAIWVWLLSCKLKEITPTLGGMVIQIVHLSVEEPLKGNLVLFLSGCVWETDINTLHWRNYSLGPFSQLTKQQCWFNKDPQVAGLIIAHAEWGAWFNKVNEGQINHRSYFPYPPKPSLYIIHVIVLHF